MNIITLHDAQAAKKELERRIYNLLVEFNRTYAPLKATSIFLTSKEVGNRVGIGEVLDVEVVVEVE